MGGMCTKYGEDREGVPYYRRHYNEDDIDYEYVIFDDDSDFLLGQANNLIQTSQETALVQADIDKARKILNREV